MANRMSDSEVSYHILTFSKLSVIMNVFTHSFIASYWKTLYWAVFSLLAKISYNVLHCVCVCVCVRACVWGSFNAFNLTELRSTAYHYA